MMPPGVRQATTVLRPHAAALIPGLIAVGMMVLWAVHDGGYDRDTWYWGALVFLTLLAATVIARGLRPALPSTAARVALIALALYTAWSFLSITWAHSPGDALDGSNRTLLYLLVFALMVLLPWTTRAALAALVVFATGIGVTAVVLLFRLASADHVPDLLVSGRLAAPTGYINSTAALFTIGALIGIALGARRELPGALRGLLLAFASADLHLAVVVQSRGWLFTLPLVALVAIAVVPDRLRVVVAAVLPMAATLVPVHRLLDLYKNAAGPGLAHAASRAGHSGLLVCAAVFFLATLLAWVDSLLPMPRPSAVRRRLLGTFVAAVAVAGVAIAAQAATHGHPVRFIERQWKGFSHPQHTASGSHFTDVGSGRYDFWRVALDAFAAHPVGGLGQDNFVNYYTPRRRTKEEPSWTHSLWLRLLAHTGGVGFVLFVAFLVAGVIAALPARRRAGLDAVVAGAALLPLVVWLIHGSVDWFWEMPALSGPALGFLGMTGALAGAARREEALAAPPRGSLGARRVLVAAAGGLVVVACTAALAFPYLSVRETSIASDVASSDPVKALSDLQTAADLDSLSAVPGRLAGTIALQTGRYAVARDRFAQVTARDPGGWYGWLGSGLAASALGHRSQARRDFETAASIEASNPAIQAALRRVDTADPLSPTDALRMLLVAD
jgi:hypothetical protein